jgi:hypothetical protein
VLHEERPKGLRLRIDQEASALIVNNGANAFSIACQRAEEASSDEIAYDWSGVAAVIGRRTKKRPSLLAYLLRKWHGSIEMNASDVIPASRGHDMLVSTALRFE